MSERRDVTGSVTFGFIFIAIGLLALLHELDVITMSWRFILPTLLIVAGIAVIVSTQSSANRRT